MKPIHLIFDTDLGSDCDDVMALVYLIYAKRHLGLQLHAIAHSHVAPEGPAAIRALFRTLGEDAPPIGHMVGGTTFPDRYAKVLADRFATPSDYAPTEPAVTVMRRALAESPEKCLICGVGMFSNIAALLQSKPDEISPLDGVALVRERCEKIVLMAGYFTDNADGNRPAEWNVKCDVPAAQAFAALCPVPCVLLPFEVGYKMISGKHAVSQYGDTTPLSVAFSFYDNGEGRHSWDPATAVYAVEGVKDLLREGVSGNLQVSDTGVTHLLPDSAGLFSVLSLARSDARPTPQVKEEFAAYIDACAARVMPKV